MNRLNRLLNVVKSNMNHNTNKEKSKFVRALIIVYLVISITSNRSMAK